MLLSIIQAAPLLSSLLSSKINSPSASLFGGVSRIKLYLLSVYVEDSPLIQHSPRWLINPLFPHSVPLF